MTENVFFLGQTSLITNKKRRISKKTVTLCIGSSCHLKGSKQVLEQLQQLISDNNLGNKVELGGTFCMGNCKEGVCVTVDGNLFSVTPETTEEFFEKEIKAKA